MNKQQKQNLASLYRHVNKRIAIIAPDGDLSFRETPDAYLMEQLVEILKYELAKNESLEAHVSELVASLQTRRREYLALEAQLDAVKQSSRTLFESYHLSMQPN